MTVNAAKRSWLLKGLRRRTLTAQVLARVVPLVERLNRRFSKVPNVAVFDNDAFPWVGEIEREWRTIRAELDHVLMRKNELPGFEDIFPDVASITRDRRWKSFMLTGMGITSKNVGRCPQTWRILQRIPGLSMAMFSIFEPGERLPAHRGPYNGVLRFHLGLIVPSASNDVAIRVGSQVRHWEEGAALIFDDSYDHEAWNESEHVRAVLFVDFTRPLRFPANVVNALLLRLSAFSLFVKEAHDNQRRWEREFYGAQSGARSTSAFEERS